MFSRRSSTLSIIPLLLVLGVLTVTSARPVDVPLPAYGLPGHTPGNPLGEAEEDVSGSGPLTPQSKGDLSVPTPSAAPAEPAKVPETATSVAAQTTTRTPVGTTTTTKTTTNAAAEPEAPVPSVETAVGTPEVVSVAPPVVSTSSETPATQGLSVVTVSVSVAPVETPAAVPVEASPPTPVEIPAVPVVVPVETSPATPVEIPAVPVVVPVETSPATPSEIPAVPVVVPVETSPATPVELPASPVIPVETPTGAPVVALSQSTSAPIPSEPAGAVATNTPTSVSPGGGDTIVVPVVTELQTPTEVKVEEEDVKEPSVIQVAPGVLGDDGDQSDNTFGVSPVGKLYGVPGYTPGLPLGQGRF